MKKRIISIFVLLVILISSTFYSVYGNWLTDAGNWLIDKAADIVDTPYGYVFKLNPATASFAWALQIRKNINDKTDSIDSKDEGNITENDIYDFMVSYADFFAYNETAKSESTHLSYYINQNGIIKDINNDKISRNQNAINKIEHEFTDEQLNILIQEGALDTTNRNLIMLRLMFNKRYRNAIDDYLSHEDNDIRNEIGVRNSYKTKFKYNINQINQYAIKFTRENLSINLVGTELNTIKKVWKLKLAADKDKNTSPFSANFTTRNDLYVSKDEDDFDKKMNYDRDQIQLFLALFGRQGLQEMERDCVLTEWNYFLNNNRHSDYFSKYARNGIWTTNGDAISIIDKHEWNQDDENAYKAALNNSNSILSRSINAPIIDDDDFRDPNLTSDELNRIRVAVTYSGGMYTLPERTGSINGEDSKTDLDTIVTSGEDFLQNGDSDKIQSDNLQNLSNSIYNILLAVGIIIAVLVGAIIGIRFMVGSVEEKADVKKLLIPYIVGCVVVFGAFGIWKILVTILAGI